jgi:aminoglycoside phosphotransferase (APT) family kinase protein
VIETLSRTHLHLLADCHLAITFFAEGAYNKLYSIAVSYGGDSLGSCKYIFRVTSPVEPFYKTASEVATLSYIREHTSVPVPRVIAYSSTAKNELGCEWILMERVPGVALDKVWSDIDFETKSRQTKLIAGFVRQLRQIQPPFAVIGNLYFREDIDSSSAEIRVVPTEDNKYVLGPIVTAYMFAGGRKLRVSRNLGPYGNDAEYITALTATELEEIKLLQSAEPHSHGDFDEDLAEEAEDIIGVLNELQTISTALFPSRLRHLTLHHHDLSTANILINPATYEVTGIVDWECVGTRSHWEDTYSLFLLGPEIEGQVEPLAPGDKDDARVERWENWEKMKLRLVFDQELSEARHEYNEGDEVRREFKEQLDWVEVSQRKVKNWMQGRIERRMLHHAAGSGIVTGDCDPP